MKVAMVSPYDYASPGGVTSHVSQLSKGLLIRGHDVHDLAPHSKSCEPKYENPPLIPLGRSVPIPIGGSVARLSLSWWLSKKISRILERESYDLIHVHEPFSNKWGANVHKKTPILKWVKGQVWPTYLPTYLPT